jgi:hypothetical protein
LIKNCVVCGQAFDPKKKNYIQITCSPECSKIRWNQKKIAREEKLKVLRQERKQQRELEREQKQEQRLQKQTQKKPPSNRIRTGFREEELKLALEIVRFNAPPAGRCPQCGQNNWRYSIMQVDKGSGNLLKAQCRQNECRWQKYFNMRSHTWGLPTGQKHRIGADVFDDIGLEKEKGAVEEEPEVEEVEADEC